MTNMRLSQRKASAFSDIPAGYTPSAGDARWNGSNFQIYNGSSWVNVGEGSGGGDQTRVLNITGADLSYTDPATPGTYAPGGTPPTGMPGVRLDVLDFADGANKNHAGWTVGSFYPNYSGQTLSLKLTWASTATSGSVVWNAAFAAMNAGDDISNKVFASPQTVTTAAPGTDMTLVTSTITFTQAQADAVAAGDLVCLIVQRDPTNGSDDMAGTARLLSATLSWS